jgi:hypothetical protein
MDMESDTRSGAQSYAGRWVMPVISISPALFLRAGLFFLADPITKEVVL